MIILNSNILCGQHKIFDNILKKAERNLDANYYTDSISAIRHSEYIVDNSTKELKKIIQLEYFPTPIWGIDGNYYNQK